MELLYKIAITRIPKVGAVTAKTLVSYCGGVKAVFEARKKDLLKIPGIGVGIASSIVKQDVLKEAEREIEFIEKNQISALFYLDEEYPLRLKHYPDSPVMLFFKGSCKLETPRTVAIVGTRNPSPYGKAICQEIIEGLKPFNILLLSGLAYGIDITAHRKCLEAAIPTVGVLGHGLRHFYPPQHKMTARKMLENGGLLTEYLSHIPVEREHFPMRNRIIAGLCDVLIVIETAARGGSMISAQIANEYNKDVFAVPGRIKDKLSKGCNHLIKTHKAALIESAADLAYIMRWEEAEVPRQVQKQLFVELSKEEKIVVDLLARADAMNIDKLTYEAKMTNSEMASLLLSLEFKGIVNSLPGKCYILI